jgi:hypothetical protein
VVGAEESLRMRAGAAAGDVTIKAKPPSAMNATGIMTNTSCQNVYGKPGALVLG